MKRQSKAAFEKNWTDRGYKYDATELKAHLMNKGNYGVLTGFGDLTVIDADIKEVEELVKNNLPETLTVRSGGGGCHFYYRCPELEKPIRLKDEKPGDVGDVQHDGKMVVGPNSIHLSGNKYKIENKRKIAEVKPEDIKEALKKYVAKDDTDINDEILKETKKKIDDRNHKNINDQLSISQVVPLYNLKNLGDGIYQGSHPIHGSGSGWNFKVDTKRNIWVCFRHYDGTHAAAGGPVGYVAMEEGIAKCEDFKNNNPLKGKKFIEVLNILKEKHGFEIDESYKKKDSNDENGEDDKQKKDPDRFFNDGGFVPKFLADEIMSDVNFVVNKESEEIFYYDKGVYKSGGEGLVKELSDKKLEKKAKNHYVNETVERVRNHYKTRTDTRKFQGVENRIVVENGILDLEERVLKPHNPDEIHLEKLPVKYNPEADCPEIKKFLRSLFEDEKNVKKVQELIGYTLLKDNRLNKAFIGLGPGGNGRSTLFELLRAFIGPEDTAAVDLSDLVNDKFASSDLFGKLANFCADISNRKIRQSGRFKTLVGEDTVRGQKKHQPAFNFKNYATPWFSANELPETEDKTRSFFRRWVILNFPFTFTNNEEELKKEGFKKKNPDLPESLLTEEELSGLLNWALVGLERVLEKGKFNNERTIEEKRELWLKESDPVKEFIDEWCIEEPEIEIEKDIIRTAYRKFCLKNDYNLLPDQTLTKKLKKYGVTKSRPRTDDGRVQCYKGIYINPDILEENKELVKVVKGSSIIVEKYENIRYSNNDICIRNDAQTPDHPDQNSLNKEEKNLDYYDEKEGTDDFYITKKEICEIIEVYNKKHKNSSGCPSSFIIYSLVDEKEIPEDQKESFKEYVKSKLDILKNKGRISTPRKEGRYRVG